MEIVNQYGQLIGEYSRLDHELWLTPPENHQPISDSIDALECKTLSSHLHESIADLPISEYTDNTVTDGGLTFVKNNSFSLKDSSQNQSRTISPDSVLQRRRFPIEITFVTKRARSKRCRSRKKFSRSRVYDPLFQSENHMELFSLEETIDSCPGSAKLVRSRKISDLLQDTKSQLVTTSLDGPQLEVSKKCLHCETEKTRQWRDGPLGQNTLCNACGIQYKIGLIDANDPPSRTPTFDTSLPKVHPVKKPYSTLYQKNVQETRSNKSKVPRKYNKKCQHCETSITPQWRPGPMGRNSLCNACGVQYRNGRLFPEYRPLKSPTYNPSLHSHLPKKFQKMRMRKISEEEKQAMS